jgi:ABC-type glycerol-3-phosphate transport system permease component
MIVSIQLRKKISRIFNFCFSMIIIILITFPLLWLFMASIKTNEEVSELPIHWLPKNPTLQPFIDTWIGNLGYTSPWITYFLNTLVITFSTTFLVVALGTMAGYGLARYKIKGKNLMTTAMLIAQLFTGPALMIPIFTMASKLGLYNTHIGLILVYIVFQTPFSILMSYSNFQNLPIELEEAATVDGCTQFGTFIRIMLPISRISLVTVALMTFLLTWGEYEFATTLLDSETKFTVSVGLAKFITEINIYWNWMAAAALIVSIPVLFMLIFAQRYFVKGLAAGAIKN